MVVYLDFIDLLNDIFLCIRLPVIPIQQLNGKATWSSMAVSLPTTHWLVMSGSTVHSKMTGSS